ncbi:MAG TPA: HEAT repeat domain-containing protein, partial [Candidatus Binataceae bacterium]|nr:HEAT repeat domain-containing protein [Candidatus Binataceae bacterium]
MNPTIRYCNLNPSCPYRFVGAEAMIRYFVLAGRIFIVAMVIATIAAGAAWAQNGKPGSQSPPDVSQLIQQLKSLDSQKRVHAAREFDKIKPLPPEAIEALVEMLRTAPYNEAQYAIKALSEAGPRAITPLAALANTGNKQAVWTLGRMAFSEPGAWPVLVGLFKSDFSDIRSAVPSQLAKAGPPVVPLLVKALTDEDPRARAGAADTLAHMGHMPGNAVGVRYSKPADLAPAAPQLVKLLSDPNSEVRDHAAFALAYADPSDTRAAPILGQMLDRGANFEVIGALQNMGSNAKSAIPALERILAGNRDWLICVNAAHALAKIGGTDACAPLAQAIVGNKNDLARGWVTDATNSINEVRVGTANAIVEISPVCPQTIPTLIATLGKPWSAADALTKLGSPAIPALVTASKSPDLKVREDAVQTLAAIRPVAPAAVRALTLALRKGSLDLDSRQAAVGALADVKPPTPEAMDGLMLALKDKSNTVRSTAAGALQNLGGLPGRAARAELKREQLAEAQRSEPDTRRYSKEELIATIRDPDREYPLSLKYLVPILPAPAPIDEAPFVVTAHAGEDNAERLIFWKKTGIDRYRKLEVMNADPGNQEHFEVPITFQAIVEVTTAGGHQSEEQEFFVEIPVRWWRSGEERIFAVDGDGWHPVEIESPE